MTSPLISVIVPIYKVEDYLLECVKSITRQTYTNLEIILVDDGSPDRCPQMCDQLASEDARIKVIHKPNGGLSDARNAGIDAATGEYTLFIDSDDFWINSSVVQNLVNYVLVHQGVEIVAFGRTTYIQNRTFVKMPPKPENLNIDDKLKSLTVFLIESDFVGAAYQKLIKTTLLKDHKVYFEKGMLSEDLDWSIRLYLVANRFGSVYYPFYGYRKREGSITQSFNPRHASDLNRILSRWDETLTNSPEHKPFRGYLAYVYSCALGSIGLLSSQDRKNYYKKFRRFTHLLGYDTNPKVKKVKILYRLLGYRLTCFVLTSFLKYRPKRMK